MRRARFAGPQLSDCSDELAALRKGWSKSCAQELSVSIVLMSQASSAGNVNKWGLERQLSLVLRRRDARAKWDTAVSNASDEVLCLRMRHLGEADCW